MFLSGRPVICLTGRRRADPFAEYLLRCLRVCAGVRMASEEGDAPSYAAEGGGDWREEHVMSEVHHGCPANHPGPHISHFTISFPPGYEQIEDSLKSTKPKVCEVDEDGDLILTRRNYPPKDSFVISIQHNITSSIPRVGLQVWRAELVLADIVLHKMHELSDFEGIVAVELGAGTDRGDDVLENCAKNINLNCGIFHRKASIYVRELDWNHPWPPEVLLKSPSQLSCGWSMSEVEEVQRASLLLAADVIYSDDLTDAFFSVLELIMSTSPEKVLYLALEKRYNFSIDDLDVVANGYSHFRSYLKVVEDMGEEEGALGNECWCRFVGRIIDLEEIPQYVQEYSRGNDVELWEIKYVKK